MLIRPRILALAIALAACAPAGLAQEPQDETPSLTTEDVKGPEPVVRPTPGVGGAQGATAPGVDELWHEVYKGLSRQGMPDADLVALRAVIDGGGELGLALRFDVDADGRIENFAVRRPTGIGWIDRKISAEAAGNQLGRDVAGFRDVDVDLGVSRGRVHARASLVAPTVEKATEIEQAVRMLAASGVGLPHGPAVPGITVSRSGAGLSLSLDVSLDEIMRGRAR